MAKTAWRCSQCGTVNEPGARACRSCGKWPSLFDLQDSAVPDDEAAPETFEVDELELDTFEPETLEPQIFGEEVDDGKDETRKSRFPRWAITAIWVVGVLVWLVVNGLADR